MASKPDQNFESRMKAYLLPPLWSEGPGLKASRVPWRNQSMEGHRGPCQGIKEPNDKRSPLWPASTWLPPVPGFPDSWGKLDLAQGPAQALPVVPRRSRSLGAPSTSSLPHHPASWRYGRPGLWGNLSGLSRKAAIRGRGPCLAQQELQNLFCSPRGRRPPHSKQLGVTIDHCPLPHRACGPNKVALGSLQWEKRKQMQPGNFGPAAKLKGPQVSLVPHPPPQKPFTSWKKEGHLDSQDIRAGRHFKNHIVQQ